MTASDDDSADPRRDIGLSRRAFTDSVGAAGLALMLGLTRPALGQHAHGKAMLGPPGMQPASTEPHRIFLTDAEAAFVDAAVARLIPSEGNGPGGIEAGVPNFIDKQLGGAWGQGERLFMGGPWDPNAIPQLGYQLPYAPADLFRRSVGAIGRQLQAQGKTFAGLPPDDQDAYLRDQLENGGAGDLDGVPAKTFFEHFLQLTIEGYFADPIYGGNKDMVAWKAIGFPGAYASFRNTVGRHGQPFVIDPVSLADHDRIPAHDMDAMESQR